MSRFLWAGPLQHPACLVLTLSQPVGVSTGTVRNGAWPSPTIGTQSTSAPSSWCTLTNTHTHSRKSGSVGFGKCSSVYAEVVTEVLFHFQNPDFCFQKICSGKWLFHLMKKWSTHFWLNNNQIWDKQERKLFLAHIYIFSMAFNSRIPDLRKIPAPCQTQKDIFDKHPINPEVWSSTSHHEPVTNHGRTKTYKKIKSSVFSQISIIISNVLLLLDYIHTLINNHKHSNKHLQQKQSDHLIYLSPCLHLLHAHMVGCLNLCWRLSALQLQPFTVPIVPCTVSTWWPHVRNALSYMLLKGFLVDVQDRNSASLNEPWMAPDLLGVWR